MWHLCLWEFFQKMALRERILVNQNIPDISHYTEPILKEPDTAKVVFNFLNTKGTTEAQATFIKIFYNT